MRAWKRLGFVTDPVWVLCTDRDEIHLLLNNARIENGDTFGSADMLTVREIDCESCTGNNDEDDVPFNIGEEVEVVLFQTQPDGDVQLAKDVVEVE